MAQVEEKGKGNHDYTEDGTVDLKGRPVLRSKTGKWKACSFILGYDMFERLAFHGIATNLVVYLTTELHQGTVTASNNVTNWNGVVWMTPILGAYVADAHLGRFWTSVFSSLIYLTGMILLTLAVSVPALRPPPCTTATTHGLEGESCAKASALQAGVFYLALYVITVGAGGTKPNIIAMGPEQFDEFEPKEKVHKLSFFNWASFCVFLGHLVSETVLVYVQDNVGWSLGYALPTAGLGLAVAVFCFGAPFYRHKRPSGSPFAKMARVFVGAFRKWKLSLPDDPKELHELSLEQYNGNKLGVQRIDHTPSLRFLDKAAVKSGPTNTPWNLSPVTQVEETKQIVKLLPLLLATFIPAIISAQSHTLFIKQATTLDRSMGPEFAIPPASMSVFTTLFMLTALVAYDRCLVPLARRRTKNPRGISLLQRFGAGLVLHIIISLTAFFAERKRLAVARESGALGKKDTVPLSVFVLFPQFALMGVADAFLEVAKLEFFYDQAPEGMKSLGSSFFSTSKGVGNFLSSVVLTAVSDATKRIGNGQKGWVLDNLNVSHLDYYYALLAVLASMNLLYFLLVAKSFVYNAEAKRSNMGSDALET